MKSIDGLVHIGITVSDIERSIAFYEQNFGFKLVGRTEFDEAFFAAAPTLYGLEDTTCPLAILAAPGGVQLELFQFVPQLEKEHVPWNRVGITHIALATDNVLEMCPQLRANGVTFCMEPLQRPDGGYWVFLRDPDGNMIELMEPFAIG